MPEPRLRAVRFSINYNDRSEEHMVEELVVAFRENRGIGIVYSIGLITPRSRYTRLRMLVNALQGAWEIEASARIGSD
jgi:hypothetical protein